MADTALPETSPWAGDWRTGRHGGGTGEPGISVLEAKRSAMALMSLRRGHGADLARLASIEGLSLPAAPRWVEAHGLTVLWAGPGQWMLRRLGSYADLEAHLAGLAPHATFIDQSHARAVLTTSGPRVREMMAKGFEIDLHPRAFRTGDVAMTVAAGVSALVWQLDDRPTYEIAVPRSMAGSFWHWMSEAAAEFGYRIGDSAADP